jgi:Zn-dependent protease with chaperone function
LLSRELAARRPVQVLAWLIVYCLCAATMIWAQEDDEDYEPAIPTASLSLRYDSSGQANVSFFTLQEINDWSALDSALSHALHCPAGSLKHPPAPPLPRKYLERLSTEQRQAAERQMTKAWAGRLEGTCLSAMVRSDFVLSTDLSFKDVLKELQKAGNEQLMVIVSLPAAQHFEYTPGLPQLEQEDSPNPRYLFKTASSDSAVVHLEFGFRNKDVYRTIATSAAFLLLPLLIVFWMQRAALRGAEDDATAAWFSYVRVLNWCTLSVTLFWMVGRSLREGLDDLTTYYFPHDGATAIAIRVAILIVPPWLITLLCLLSSHRVYVRVRGLTWSRGEFYAAQISQVATQVLPLMCIVAGLELLYTNYRWAMGLFAASYFVLMICARLQLKITGTHPEALTAGELRDRVFELAKRAATELRQVFVMPAGKSQMANAFASGNKTVLFTDYLLARLNKREVTAIAAHEITHLQKSHHAWKGVGVAGLILSAVVLRGVMGFVVGLLLMPLALSSDPGTMHLASLLRRIEGFPELDLVFFLIGLAFFYWQSRIMENSADAGAVRLTGDPEALMTGLLKLGRLNLMPVQWGRVSETFLTHPSTLKRVERIGRIGQVPAARVQEIVAQYRQSGGVTEEPVAPQHETFSDAAAPAQRVTTTAKAAQSAMNKLWVLLFFHVAPAAAISYVIGLLHLEGAALATVYIGGALACLAIYFVITLWMAVWGRKRLEQEVLAKLQSDGFSSPKQEGRLVGLSPHPTPRFYVATFNWDDGYLFAARDGLYFIGDQARFKLDHGQIRDIRLGPGVPNWFRIPRIYIDWWDSSRGVARTFNLAPMRPCSFWNLRKEAAGLEQWLRAWMTNPRGFPEPSASMAGLQPPSLGEVTSRSIKSLHTARSAFNLAFWIVTLAVLTSIFVGATTFYVCGVVLLLRLYEHLPNWWAKEQGDAKQTTTAKAAGA